MEFRRLIIGLCALLLFGAWHLPAEAALKFGTSEKIRYVADVSLQGPHGEKLFLARKIAEHHFLLPYSFEDQGYVLGVSGDSKRYFAMPQGPQLEAMQRAGLLPQTLPPFEFSGVDRLIANLLWIVLGGLAAYGAWAAFRPKGKAAGVGTSAGAGIPLDAAPVTTRFSGKDVSLPMTLYPGRMKMFVMLAGSLAFVAGGLFMLDNSKMIGYLSVAFFGLCALVFLVQLLTRTSYLIVDAQKFTVSSLSRKSDVAWSDVERFLVVSISGNKMVGWNFNPGYSTGTSHALAVKLAGVQNTLPDTYGMKAEELADLMNEVRMRSTVAPG